MAGRKIILPALRFALGGIFVYAGLAKIADAQNFARDIQHYELTSAIFSTLIAIYLPWLEIFSGIAIIIRKCALGAAMLLVLMNTIFLGAITSAWARGLDISCGCFGKEEHSIQTNFPRLVFRDGALLAAASIIFLSELREFHERKSASQKTA